MLAYLLNYLMTYLPQDEEGQGMAEYGLILALIAVVVIGALTLMGGNLETLFNDLAGDLVAAP
jgi:pilus assembly protein Flp/PilA